MTENTNLVCKGEGHPHFQLHLPLTSEIHIHNLRDRAQCELHTRHSRILDSMEVSTDTEHHNHSKSMFVDTAAQLPRIQVQKPASLVSSGELKQLQEVLAD